MSSRRVNLLVEALGAAGVLAAAGFVATACLGEDYFPQGNSSSSDGGAGGAGDSGDGLAEAGADAGDVEPAAVGTLRSVESFTVGAQFPAGSARVAFAPDGSFVIGFTFVGRTAIRDSALQGSDGHEIGVAKIRSDGTVAWARAFGGPGDDDLLALAVDDAGDVYIAGGFKSASVTFETARARNGSAEAPFVAKLAGDSGSAVASVTFDKAASPGGRCTGLAARSGVVAVGCSMDDGKAAVMEGSSSVDVVAPGGSSGIFVAELEPSTLAPIWSNALGGPGGDRVNAIALTPSGDLVFAAASGYPSDVIFSDAKLSLNVTIARVPTAIIGRLSRANGTALWARPFGTATFGDGIEARTIAVDRASRVVFTGDLRGTVAFGGVEYTAAGGSTILARLRDDGSPDKARQLGGTTSIDDVSGIAIDPWDNILVTGVYRSADYKIDQLTLVAPGQVGAPSFYVAKLDASFVGRWAFASAVANAKVVVGQGIDVSRNGDVAQLALFSGFVSFGEASPRQSTDAGLAIDLAVVTRAP